MARVKRGSEPNEAVKSGYPPGTRRLSVNLDEKLIKAAKRRALDQDVSLTDLVSEILKKALGEKADDPDGHALLAT